jgi:hypothetical protein
VRESCTPGSVRGAPGNGWPYRDSCATMPETQACLCGGTEFQRVVVERPGQPYTTEFLVCRRCGVMFFAPIKPAPGCGAGDADSAQATVELGPTTTVTPFECRRHPLLARDGPADWPPSTDVS